MKVSTKSAGKLTGKLVSSAKALPKKTAQTSKSLKEEFIAGFKETAVQPK